MVERYVYFDYQAFSSGRRGGISKYFAQLACGVQNYHWSPRLPFLLTVNEHFAEMGGRGLLELPAFRGAARVCRIVNHAVARRAQGDVWHSTYYDKSLLARYPGMPLVVTVHDMTPELMPQFFDANPHEGKRDYVRAATRIIAVSENTKKDLMALYDHDGNNIDVVHHGIDLDQRSLHEVALPSRFLLFVGSRSGYKNFMIAAQAVARLQKTMPDLALVCIGSKPFSAAEMEQLASLNLRCAICMAASDGQLRYAMTRAVALVYPSLYEGFGMPLIEAMAEGCPLAISNASSMPEIAQDAAEYFEPDCVDSIATALERLTRDEGRRRELISIGRILAKSYSIQNTVRRTAAVYEMARTERRPVA